MSKLYFRYGAMGSAKTAQALMLAYNYKERGHNILMFKPRIDNREGVDIIKSRCGLESKDVFLFDKNINLFNTIWDKSSLKFDIDWDSRSLDCIYKFKNDIVIVDESQFLTKDQVLQLAEFVDYTHMNIFCYGLRTNFKGELFEGSQWLMAYSDSIEEIKTICWCGKKATFNARICNGKVVRDGEEILIGGNDSYISLCRRHWKSGQISTSL